MISKKHQTIFVHIPKVAGQSIESMFLNDLNLNWKQRDELLLRKKRINEKGPQRLAHLKAYEYLDLNYIDKQSFDSFFKFSFVRNPYSRAYSYYKYLGYSKIISFDYFLSEVLKKKVEQGHFFFIPQTDYLYYKNQLLVDFVGKFETIEEDIKVVVEKANLTEKVLPHVNKSKNETKRGVNKVLKNPAFLLRLKTNNPIFKDYKKAYDKASIELIKLIYKEDIDKFQYEFE
ncbi:sulfotransferase family 2 domain-containing protein [uncultured Psychroserpens sp.]|uniref:sulfotransferase family 2 domain-containing protein n=1 Tax=uncultured Psychroserpens sp. TaxID=255436 RepID=UPI00260EC8EF|nr:sulfotransferase family 2 domain-containing protein [uncultured Psychroserpens sp.]